MKATMSRKVRTQRAGCEDTEVFFHSGWRVSGNSYDGECRADGGKFCVRNCDLLCEHCRSHLFPLLTGNAMMAEIVIERCRPRTGRAVRGDDNIQCSGTSASDPRSYR